MNLQQFTCLILFTNIILSFVKIDIRYISYINVLFLIMVFYVKKIELFDNYSDTNTVSNENDTNIKTMAIGLGITLLFLCSKTNKA